MHPFIWPSIVTLLTVLVMLATAFLVAKARSRYGLAAPATTGNPDFERYFRIQMNTLEASALFLPTLWIDAMFGNGTVVALAGLTWVAGRIVYIVGYAQAPGRRSAGFGIGMLAFAVLFVDAVKGMVHLASV